MCRGFLKSPRNTPLFVVIVIVAVILIAGEIVVPEDLGVQEQG